MFLQLWLEMKLIDFSCKYGICTGLLAFETLVEASAAAAALVSKE